MHKRNNTIDLCKLIFAILIILFHVPIENVVVDIIRNYLSRLGVPFFFAVSGYFLNTDFTKKRFVMFEKHILKLFCTYSIIYSPVLILNESGFKSYLQKLFFLSPAYLWYLLAAAIGSLLMFSFRNKKHMGLYISAVLYFAGTIGNTYSSLFNIDEGLYYHIFLTTRNGLFFAWFIMEIGRLVREITFSFKKNLIILFFSYAVFVLEVSLYLAYLPISKDYSMWFSLPFVIFCLISILTKLDFPNNKVCKYFAPVSTGIYCMQFGFIAIYSVILSKAFNSVNGFVVYILVVFSGTIASIIFVRSRLLCRVFL